jgi:hypothetical protein
MVNTLKQNLHEHTGPETKSVDDKIYSEYQYRTQPTDGKKRKH